ncbi:unnamed protein product [Paramecium pentaurelia]|uniref:Transmembrane protein n=1 Tax=Paramecium pentaurelia TaxID=43138 RepID=A0A8S1YEQ1_9CILI|nr:unnamed protein product [Paramecium pentaurelia]
MDPKQPRNPLNKRMTASLKERNLMSSKVLHLLQRIMKNIAILQMNELDYLMIQQSLMPQLAKQRPIKYKIEYSEFSFPNINGGFVIKITPIIQVIISIAVLILIFSFLNTQTNIRVVQIGLVFIKTTASETATNFNEEKQAKNPNIPIAPLNNSLFIIFQFFGYDYNGNI